MRGARGKYTPERVEKIINLIKAGNYARTAAMAVGISEDTYYTWKKTKPEFSEAIKKAESEAEARNVVKLQEMGEVVWQVRAWWLERRFPDRWGRKAYFNVETKKIDGFVDALSSFGDDEKE